MKDIGKFALAFMAALLVFVAILAGTAFSASVEFREYWPIEWWAGVAAVGSALGVAVCGYGFWRLDRE